VVASSPVLKKIAKILAHAALWLVIALIALELVLQALALVVKDYSWRAKTQWLSGHVRVLALGDSNTYGLYLPAQESYPSQLEHEWNRAHPDLPIDVINLGYPGTNSFRLLANLPDILDTFKPDLVLVMIGFNDFWTPVENINGIHAPSWAGKLLYRSRTYTLFYMVWQRFNATTEPAIDSGERMLGGFSGLNLTGDESHLVEQKTGVTFADITSGKIDPEHDTALKQKLDAALRDVIDARKNSAQKPDILNTVKVGDKTFSLGIADGAMAGNSQQMEKNLLAMIALLDAHNTPFFLLDYPSNHGYYPAANRKIHRVAEQTHSRFIALDNTFTTECRNKPSTCPDLFFYDGHATAQGNAAVSVTVMKSLDDYFGKH